MILSLSLLITGNTLEPNHNSQIPYFSRGVPVLASDKRERSPSLRPVSLEGRIVYGTRRDETSNNYQKILTNKGSVNNNNLNNGTR